MQSLDERLGRRRRDPLGRGRLLRASHGRPHAGALLRPHDDGPAAPAPRQLRGGRRRRSHGAGIYYFTKDGAPQPSWWRLAQGRLVDDHLDGTAYVGQIETYLYPHFGLTVTRCA